MDSHLLWDHTDGCINYAVKSTHFSVSWISCSILTGNYTYEYYMYVVLTFIILGKWLT